jgi:hypothetical protein
LPKPSAILFSQRLRQPTVVWECLQFGGDRNKNHLKAVATGFDKTADPHRNRHSFRLISNDNRRTLPKTVQSWIQTLDNLLTPLNLVFVMFAPGCGTIGMRRKPCRVGINREPTMNLATNKESTTAVFTHKKRLSLVEVTKHTDVAVVAEPLENITGGIKIHLRGPMESMTG